MADFCYDCNHPERFHVNDWNGYRGIPKKAGPCRANFGDCRCPEFVPEPPEPVSIEMVNRINYQIEAIARRNRITFEEARIALRDALFPTEPQ